MEKFTFDDGSVLRGLIFISPEEGLPFFSHRWKEEMSFILTYILFFKFNTSKAISPCSENFPDLS